MLSLGFEFQETNGNSVEVTVHHSWVFRLYTSLLVNWNIGRNQTIETFKKKLVQFHLYSFINFQTCENVICLPRVRILLSYH